jgi:hypothetical protein
VFQLLGAGCKNKDIASTLKISVKTVETYLEKLKEKLDLSDSTVLRELAEQWVTTGAFRPPVKKSDHSSKELKRLHSPGRA